MDGDALIRQRPASAARATELAPISSQMLGAGWHAEQPGQGRPSGSATPR